MPHLKKITHVIYDLDGLLLDTETLNAQVNQKIVSRFGKTFGKFVKSKIAGRNALDSAQIIVEMLELPLTPQQYLEERQRLMPDFYPLAKPMPGARELTEHLYEHHIPQAVATSTARTPFGLKTSAHHEWFKCFNCVVLGDDPDLKQGKPAPDIFLITAQRLGVPPQQCLVFEDALAGMAAAQAAGMSVVVVPDGDMDKQLYHSADQILNSLLEFEPQLWQLPELG